VIVAIATYTGPEAMMKSLGVLALVLFCVRPALAQSSYNPPRTPDGQPDLQGVWTNETITPLERPRNLANKPFLTEAEAAAIEKQAA
jgi:hypothetical protein